MEVVSLAIPDVKVIRTKKFGDHRGFFSETYSKRSFEAAGLRYDFVQDNQSLSAEVGTLRGLHFQIPPFAQDKLLRVVKGAVFDVAVDIRKGSPTYGQWTGVELSFENGRQLLIPAGFLHGFVTLEPDTEIVYKCSDYYAPECDGGVLWSSCGIDWPFTGEPLLSDKDRAGRLLPEAEC